MIQKVLDWIQTFPLWAQMGVVGFALAMTTIPVLIILTKDITSGRFKILSVERRTRRKARRKK